MLVLRKCLFKRVCGNYLRGAPCIFLYKALRLCSHFSAAHNFSLTCNHCNIFSLNSNTEYKSTKDLLYTFFYNQQCCIVSPSLQLIRVNMNNSSTAGFWTVCPLSTPDLCVHLSLGHMVHNGKTDLHTFCFSIPSSYDVSSS